MRYAVSGQNTTAVSGGTGSATGIVAYALGQGVTTGRVFWLRGLTYTPCGSDQGVILTDGTEGQSCSSLTPVARFAGVTNAGLFMGKGIINFPAPGLKFSTGVTVNLGSTGGTGPTGLATSFIAGWGYEE